MGHPLTHSHLNQIKEDLQGVIEEVKISFASLSQEEFNWKPSPESWSVAECMKHLLIVYSKYQPQLPQKITPHALKDTAHSPHKSGFMGSIFKRFVNPEKKRKVPAPKGLQPPSNSDYPLSLQQDFIQYLEEVIRFVEKTDELSININKVSINSSVTSLIKFNLGDYFEIESMHSRLHLAQMKRVKQKMNQ